MILIDSQKLFNNIDPQMVIKKMKYVQFSKTVIAWLKSYLSEQKFKKISTLVTPAYQT